MSAPDQGRTAPETEMELPFYTAEESAAFAERARAYAAERTAAAEEADRNLDLGPGEEAAWEAAQEDLDPEAAWEAEAEEEAAWEAEVARQQQAEAEARAQHEVEQEPEAEL
jgi:hypothetical protein